VARFVEWYRGYVGSGHSGSTLLDLILGSHSCIESVGEVGKRFRERVTGQNQGRRRCACGREVSECPYWQSILSRMAMSGIAPDQFLLAEPFFQRDNEIFYAEVLRESGKSIVADSSKSLERLLQLSKISSLDVYVLHLVRDGRAVAWSHVRKHRHLRQEAARWAGKNLQLLSHASSFPSRWKEVHYEDLVTRPTEELQKIMEFIGEEFEPRQLQFRNTVHHNITGNRMVRSKSQNIVADTKYLNHLGALSWLGATFSAYRGLIAFGYPLTRRRTAALFSGVAEGPV
jgi:hypothetical protein